MGNKLPDLTPKLSKKELLLKRWKQDLREYKVSRAKAGTFRNKILNAYDILDSLRFDYLSDTAFRDKITSAKQALESTIDDFLLSDSYWERKIDEISRRSPEEHDKYLSSPVTQGAKSSTK